MQRIVSTKWHSTNSTPTRCHSVLLSFGPENCGPLAFAEFHVYSYSPNFSSILFYVPLQPHCHTKKETQVNILGTTWSSFSWGYTRLCEECVRVSLSMCLFVYVLVHVFTLLFTSNDKREKKYYKHNVNTGNICSKIISKAVLQQHKNNITLLLY
jgi:hypothetical protein